MLVEGTYGTVQQYLMNICCTALCVADAAVIAAFSSESSTQHHRVTRLLYLWSMGLQT